jgi:hypothetical protein
MKTACALASVFLLSVVAAGAQTRPEGRFQTGSISWTPTLTLRDAGVDNNVFDEPVNPKGDTVAIVSPAVQGHLQSGLWAVDFGGNVDFVYFQRYASERSINGHGLVRPELMLSRFRPFAVFDVLDTRERFNSEIDVRARRAQREVGFGTKIQAFSRTSFEVSMRRATLEFRDDEVYRGEEIAQRLNRSSTSATARMLVELTPLTRLALDGDVVKDEFTFRPDQNTDNLRVNAGFEFAPDALIQGRAKVGFHEMKPTGTAAIAFRGLTAGLDVGYVLLGRTRFDVRVLRDTSYSLEEQPYFLQTLYGAEVVHNLAGPFDLTARVSRETLDYPGIPDRNVLEHVDVVSRYGGGFAIRASQRLRIAVTYEVAERTSGESANLSYDRRRMYTTVTYGF